MAVDCEAPALQDAQTRGKGKAIFMCWLMGNGALFAWNSMLTIGDYYAILFPDYHPARVLTLVYQPFALGTTIILAYNEAKMNTRLRNLAGYIIFFISTLLVLVLDLATKGMGGLGPFIGVCALSGVFGLSDGLLQGGMTGDLSLMDPQFLQSFFAGLAASGALTSALRLLTKVAFENSSNGLRKGALLFFAISTAFELLCVFIYAYVFPKIPIVKYYRMKAAAEGSKTVTADLVAAGVEVDDDKTFNRLSNKQLLIRNLDYEAVIYLIYVLTLSIFPGFLAEDTGSHSLGSWYVLVLIATYNVFDLVGRYTPYIKALAIKNRRLLLGLTLSRFLLIPCFYFTAKYGDQGWMIFLIAVMGLSNGHLTVCCITAAPKGFKGSEQNAVGNIIVSFLLAGIFSGVTLGWLWLIGKGW